MTGEEKHANLFTLSLIVERECPGDKSRPKNPVTQPSRMEPTPSEES